MGRSKINIALFGLGRIGLMHGKNLMRNKDFNLQYVFDLNKKLVVIRSTVPPKTSSRLNCYFMPEFLTEKNFKPIVKNTPTPRRSTSVNGPHTMLLISPKITFII